MSKNPSVFILILNWNNYKDTTGCVESVLKINYPNFRIVLIDNGSNDTSEEILRKRFPQLMLLQTGDNLGFTGGNNIGIKYALKQKADYVLILNNDTVVEPGFLEPLVNSGEEDKNIGLINPLIFRFGTDAIDFAGGKISKFTSRALHTDNLLEKPDYLTGSCLLIKREVFEKIGLLDERFFLYFEDVDFSLRAKEANFKLKVEVSSKILHKISATTGKNYNPRNVYYTTRNSYYFISKHFSWLEKVTKYLGLTLVCFKICLNPFIRNYPEKLLTSKAVFLAIKDFLSGKFGRLEEGRL